MELTAFNARLGSSQGRLRVGEALAGDVVFILGDWERGHFHELVAGDYAEVQQGTDLSGVDFVRASLRLRVPSGSDRYPLVLRLLGQDS